MASSYKNKCKRRKTVIALASLPQAARAVSLQQAVADAAAFAANVQDREGRELASLRRAETFSGTLDTTCEEAAEASTAFVAASELAAAAASWLRLANRPGETSSLQELQQPPAPSTSLRQRSFLVVATAYNATARSSQSTTARPTAEKKARTAQRSEAVGQLNTASSAEVSTGAAAAISQVTHGQLTPDASTRSTTSTRSSDHAVQKKRSSTMKSPPTSFTSIPVAQPKTTKSQNNGTSATESPAPSRGELSVLATSASAPVIFHPKQPAKGSLPGFVHRLRDPWAEDEANQHGNLALLQTDVSPPAVGIVDKSSSTSVSVTDPGSAVSLDAGSVARSSSAVPAHADTADSRTGTALAVDLDGASATTASALGASRSTSTKAEPQLQKESSASAVLSTNKEDQKRAVLLNVEDQAAASEGHQDEDIADMLGLSFLETSSANLHASSSSTSSTSEEVENQMSTSTRSSTTEETSRGLEEQKATASDRSATGSLPRIESVLQADARDSAAKMLSDAAQTLKSPWLQKLAEKPKLVSKVLRRVRACTGNGTQENGSADNSSDTSLVQQADRVISELTEADSDKTNYDISSAVAGREALKSAQALRSLLAHQAARRKCVSPEVFKVLNLVQKMLSEA
ncbi:unnamed protein product [Amoebophrya sp. A25]|nr:unnamed protein product [Amoebophrya sp. A25]|eukprot:GSA25T00018414001.1